MSTTKKLAALLGAGVLSVAMFGTALAGVELDYATPTGHYSSADDEQGENSNDGPFWDAYLELAAGSCSKLTDAELEAAMNEDGSASLGVAYDYVIVKQASAAAVTYDNTIFSNVGAGETVFADTDGDGEYTEADSNSISHILVCNEVDVTEPPITDAPSEPADSPSFEASVGGLSDAPTEPNTSSIGGNSTSGPADGAWLLVVALGVLLASVVVMTPARAKSRR